jgi:hypothetical protein
LNPGSPFALHASAPAPAILNSKFKVALLSILRQEGQKVSSPALEILVIVSPEQSGQLSILFTKKL